MMIVFYLNYLWLTPKYFVEGKHRYYLLMNWRERRGKYTSGNSAEFVGVPVMYTLKGELAVSPVLGVRRAFEKHWFHEFTAGADLLCLPRMVVSPRVGYRIGYLF